MSAEELCVALVIVMFHNFSSVVNLSILVLVTNILYRSVITRTCMPPHTHWTVYAVATNTGLPFTGRYI